MAPNSNCFQRTKTPLAAAQGIRFFWWQGERTSVWSTHVSGENIGKLVPGVDKPAGSENTREQQNIPKREGVFGLGKSMISTNKAIWKTVCRIWAESSVPTVSNLWPIYKPVINPVLPMT